MKDRRIVLGITGGIAAYKAAELASRLVQEGLVVSTVMTRNATEFIAPLTLSSLTGHPVHVDMWKPVETERAEHIELATAADAVVIAPATANFLGKVASGIADDLLTTVVMATTAPVLIAPTMNTHMWQNTIVQRNVQTLKDAGYRFVEPESGWLACGWEGPGRLASCDRILSCLKETWV
jgi:phosphopantothenoylcysteine decarboxylase/phosphopantothenate--cysteine ligase